MSTFAAVVVKIETLEKHPNADTLSIVRLTQPLETVCLVKTAEWQGVDKGVYIPIDAVVPDTPEFAFLSGHRRIKARKLRGVFSMGLLMPAKLHHNVGDDVTQEIGIIKYEPPIDASIGGMNAPAPVFDITYTDIENIRKYPDMFKAGESVVVTEKVHGTNARFMYLADGLHAGGHHRWWVDSPENVYWQAVRTYKLDVKLTAAPGVVLFGEIYGWVQNLRYGHTAGKTSLVVFDAFDTKTGKYLDWEALKALIINLNSAAPDAKEIKLVPVLYEGVWPGYDDTVGRVVLKLHGEDYLLGNF